MKHSARAASPQPLQGSSTTLVNVWIVNIIMCVYRMTIIKKLLKMVQLNRSAFTVKFPV